MHPLWVPGNEHEPPPTKNDWLIAISVAVVALLIIGLIAVFH